VYNIQKGNTNDEINFYMGYNEEKGKSREDFLELKIVYEGPEKTIREGEWEPIKIPLET
jgi:hypothetical protein